MRMFVKTATVLLATLLATAALAAGALAQEQKVSSINREINEVNQLSRQKGGAHEPKLLAAKTTIQNKRYKVAVDNSTGLVSLTDLATGQAFVKDMKLLDKADLVRVAKVSNPRQLLQCQAALVIESKTRKSHVMLTDAGPFVGIHSTVINPDAKSPYVVACVDGFSAKICVGAPLERQRFVGTGLLRDLNQKCSSFTFAAVVDSQTRKGVVAAQLSQEQASGVFFVRKEGSSDVVLDCRLDFGRFQVEPSQSRGTDTLLLGFFNDARIGLEQYADAVADYYKIKLKPKPGIYCTWYHATSSDEKRIIANSAFIAKHLKPFGLDVVQIDDTWQANAPKSMPKTDSQGRPLDLAKQMAGPVRVFVEGLEDKFPNGMAYTAEHIQKNGLTAALWFMPFSGDAEAAYYADKMDIFTRWPDGTPVSSSSPWSGTFVDVTNPKGERFLRERVKRIHGWGYRQFKVDGIHAGMVNNSISWSTDWREPGGEGACNTPNFVGRQDGQGNVSSTEPSTVLHDPRLTHVQAYRKGLDIIRECAPDTYILGCTAVQNRRSMGCAFGKLDAMRLGPDVSAKAHKLLRGPTYMSHLYFMDNRIWHNDADPFYVRPNIRLHSAQLLASWFAVSGSMVSVSYQFAELPADRLDIIKRTLPAHGFTARPVDVFRNTPAKVWLVEAPAAKRATSEQEENIYVVGLLNFTEGTADISSTFEELGLPEGVYKGFEFWTNRFTGTVTNAVSARIPPLTPRVYILRRQSEKPYVLSTSRHITQGLIDVLEERFDGQTLSGKSLVVADDPYELRIAARQTPKSVEAYYRESPNGPEKRMELVEKTELGYRVRFVPSVTGEVTWRVQ